jgi:acyl-coenzyme A synthetase/AMP-(fatty) acid ligase/acyl carrier protein
MDTNYPVKTFDRILQKTPYIFDVSVWELFWANWYGASIVFSKSEGHKDTNYLIELINKESITITHFVPSMFSVLEDSVEVNKTELPSLRYIFCSGEVLTLSQVKKCHNLLPNTEIHNLYGPTEVSIDVLYYNCSYKEIEQVYIGTPISNTKAYIISASLTLVPIGGIGELYVGGVGVARGYLNRAELTAERFIANPFQSEEEKSDTRYGLLGRNARLYKTGDLVRWLPDGNLEYIGRNDFQVKIRGFRIEPGEIESILSSYTSIKQCVVIAREHIVDGNSSKYLVAYYTSVSGEKVDDEELRTYLSSKLPDYMVPSAFVFLDSLPLTINGKLDRRALPDPEFSGDSSSYVAPRNEVEAKLCSIFASVLGLDLSVVGITDDFFRLGGDSIISIQLVSRIRQNLTISNNSDTNLCTVKDIFTHRTIQRLYDNVIKHVIENKAEYSTNTILAEQGLLSGEVAMVF